MQPPLDLTIRVNSSWTGVFQSTKTEVEQALVDALTVPDSADGAMFNSTIAANITDNSAPSTQSPQASASDPPNNTAPIRQADVFSAAIKDLKRQQTGGGTTIGNITINGNVTINMGEGSSSEVPPALQRDERILFPLPSLQLPANPVVEETLYLVPEQPQPQTTETIFVVVDSGATQGAEQTTTANHLPGKTIESAAPATEEAPPTEAKQTQPEEGDKTTTNQPDERPATEAPPTQKEPDQISLPDNLQGQVVEARWTPSDTKQRTIAQAA